MTSSNMKVTETMPTAHLMEGSHEELKFNTVFSKCFQAIGAEMEFKNSPGVEQWIAEQIWEEVSEGMALTAKNEQPTSQSRIDLMEIDSHFNDHGATVSEIDLGDSPLAASHDSDSEGEPELIPLNPNRPPRSPVSVPFQMPTPEGKSRSECRRLVLESHICSEKLRIKAHDRMCHSESESDYFTISDAERFRDAEQELQEAYQEARKKLQKKWKSEKQEELLAWRQEALRKKKLKRKRWDGDELRRDILDKYAIKKHPDTRDGNGFLIETHFKRRRLSKARSRSKATPTETDVAREKLNSEIADLVELRMLSQSLPFLRKPIRVLLYETDISVLLVEEERAEDFKISRLLEDFIEHLKVDMQSSIARKGVFDESTESLCFPTVMEVAEGYRRFAETIDDEQRALEESTREKKAAAIKIQHQIDLADHSALVDRCEALVNDSRIIEWLSGTLRISFSGERCKDSLPVSESNNT